MEDKNVLLSVKDLVVKFRVRGRILTAIRGISLDIYENESIAIVGESGSGKSVFTKTFAGMLDQNGFIDEGSIVFNDPELIDTVVKLTPTGNRLIAYTKNKLDGYAKYVAGADDWKKIKALETERKEKETLSAEDEERFEKELGDLNFRRTDAINLRQTFDPKHEKDKIKETTARIDKLGDEIKALEQKKKDLIETHKKALLSDTAYNEKYNSEMAALKDRYQKEIQKAVSPDLLKRNETLAKEIYLSVGRFGIVRRFKAINQLLKSFRQAMIMGLDLDDSEVRRKVFDDVLYVRLTDETPDRLHGLCALDLSKITYPGDWTNIRGTKIATVFQDPMTSLNPIITIGKQITSVILKHQDCSEAEARRRAIDLMKKVGIPNAENRFDDYPFQYSGGMRQRIVIAIALSCQPKILICDEPTTALDVTIQAQILKLLKDLQKEYNYTIVFITHDLGVVANVADRVGVLYAGQLVELGTVEEVFYDPRHPYTWALLSSLPQLAQKNTKLYSITGTPPSLYNKVVGDAFAPRNPYCLKIDTLAEPPLFPVTETHFAKTWLLDPRSPKVEKPEIIRDIHEKLVEAYHLA